MALDRQAAVVAEIHSGQQGLSTNRAVTLAVILLVTGLLYLNSLPKEFTNWDDPKYIVENPLIKDFSISNLNQILAAPYFSNYSPLTLLSFALDFSLWSLDATGYHFHNLALHLGSAVALFVLLRRLGYSDAVALSVTGLFAVHPVNVESVSWTSERKTLLATLFFLLSFYHYHRYKESTGRSHYLASLLFFLLSILSKSTMVLAPLLFVAYDYLWRPNRLRQIQLFEKLPFLVLAETLGFLQIHAAWSYGSLHSYHETPLWLKVLSTGQLLGEYVSLLLWPAQISAIIPPLVPSPSDPALWIWAGAFPVLFFFLFRRDRKLCFWATFFVLGLLPVLNLVPIPIGIANRYLHIPQIGLWVILATAAWNLARRLKPWPLSRAAFHGCSIAWLVFLMAQTLDTARVWRNSFSLWTDTIAKHSELRSPHFNLGNHFLRKNLPDRAAQHFLAALQIDPDYAYALAGMGDYYFMKGERQGAMEHYYAAINADPDNDLAMCNLAILHGQQGQFSRAHHLCRRAALVNPLNKTAYTNRVGLFLQEGRIEDALNMAEGTIRIFPGDPDGYFSLGVCRETSGDLQGALSAWEQAKQRAGGNRAFLTLLKSRMALLQEKMAPQPKRDGKR